MTTNLSGRARDIVDETLPLMERNQALLQKALERYMVRQGPYDPRPGRANSTTRAILDMLLGHARQLAENGRASGIAETALRHRALALGGEHYFCFGDALKPIMKDVLGDKATSPVLAAWTDAYWEIVRLLFRQETRLAA
jgi:nitric oxide dioxygenase